MTRSSQTDSGPAWRKRLLELTRPRSTNDPLGSAESAERPLPGGQSVTQPPLSANPWRSYAPIVLVVLVGTLVTWLIHLQVSHLERQRRLDAFSEAARDRLLVIEREAAYALGVVQDIGSFFDASSHVTRRQFRDFVGPALKRNPAIAALKWVPRITAAEREDFIAESRRSFTPFRMTQAEDDGTLRDALPRPVHFPVLYVQPYGENKALLGLDLASRGAERAVMNAAAQKRSPSVSAQGGMRTEAGEKPVFSVYLPVFERAADDGAEDRDESLGAAPEPSSARLRGFAIGVFRTGDMVEQALANLGPSGVDMVFIESGAASERGPFYIHFSRTRGGARAREVDIPWQERPAYQGDIKVGDRLWSVVCTPVPGYFEAVSWSGRLILGGGMAFTLLSAVYLFTLIGRAEQVRNLVAQRTIELERTNKALNKEIGERRRAEQALQMLNATLEQRIARRTGEAERRARDLEQFAYVASHDLKAPLRAIANLAGWLKEDLQEKLTPETREQIDLLRDRVARMNALVEGLLAYSRIGRTASSGEEVDTAALVADTIDSIAPPDRFKVKVKPGMPRLATDRLQLGQVFANLISNAINHHDRKKGVVRVSGRDLGERCEFVVEDDGPGIPREYQEKVFMMFQTLQVKDFGVDTGIGLALVKKLVEEHGGAITLDSGPGRGSRFSFTWAKQEADTGTDENAEGVRESGGRNG